MWIVTRHHCSLVLVTFSARPSLAQMPCPLILASQHFALATQRFLSPAILLNASNGNLATVRTDSLLLQRAAGMGPKASPQMAKDLGRERPVRRQQAAATATPKMEGRAQSRRKRHDQRGASIESTTASCWLRQFGLFSVGRWVFIGLGPTLACLTPPWSTRWRSVTYCGRKSHEKAAVLLLLVPAPPPQPQHRTLHHR